MYLGPFCARRCICRLIHSSFCVFFPSCEELAGDRAAIIRAQSCLKTQRAPFSPTPHPHSQEDTQTHPAHSLESLRKAVCTYTAVKHSQEKTLSDRGKSLEKKKMRLKDEGRACRSPRVQEPSPSRHHVNIYGYSRSSYHVGSVWCQELPWTGRSEISEADKEAPTSVTSRLGPTME